MMVQQVLAGGDLPAGLADVFLVLISKSEHSTYIAQFRSISLCNVLYKVLTKVIINRLKDFLSDPIALVQSSFIPGCQMIDNVIICQDSFTLSCASQEKKEA